MASRKRLIRLIVSRSKAVCGCGNAPWPAGSVGESRLTLELAHLVILPSRLPQAAELMIAWVNKQHEVSLVCVQCLFDQGVPLLPLVDDLLLIIKKLYL